VPRGLVPLDESRDASIICLLHKSTRILLERTHLVCKLRVLATSRVVRHISVFTIMIRLRLVGTHVVRLTLSILQVAWPDQVSALLDELVLYFAQIAVQ